MSIRFARIVSRQAGLAFVLWIVVGAVPLASARADAPVIDRVLPAPDSPTKATPDDYRIGPLDELNIVVYPDKDLTLTVDVDASGRIVLPLAGAFVAAGETPAALSQEIATSLKARYYQDPQVAVVVAKANSEKVTVEGEVAKPGVYPIDGHTTLIQAIALANGADAYADYRHVMVFRYVNNQRHVAVFDLDQINKGRVDDPRIYSNDTVIVERSNVKAAFRDFVAPLAPLIYVFPELLTKF